MRKFSSKAFLALFAGASFLILIAANGNCQQATGGGERAAATAAGVEDEELALMALLAADWTNVEAHMRLGGYRERQNQPSLAAASYEQAASLFTVLLASPDEKARGFARAGLIAASERLALIKRAPGPSPEALKWEEQAFFLGSGNPAVLALLAEDYLSFRRYNAALAVCDKGVSIPPRGDSDPDAAEVRHLRGISLYYLGDFDASAADYAEAEKLGLKTVELYGNWAFTLEGQERWMDALAMWTKVATMDVPAENKAMVEEHIAKCKGRAAQ
ncbi:MAG: hypothetical protein HRF49_12175 [bacterium]